MTETTSAFIAIVGKPNVGKSSLLNRLVGEKVAIVTNKPQTTRTRITGVLTKEECQLVFFDTPGLHKPKTALSQYMVKQVGDTVADVDLAVLVVETTGPITKAEQELIESFRKQHLPAIAVINKIDTIKDKSELMPKMAALSEAFEFDQIIPLSARSGEGCDLLLSILMGYGEESPHFFPDDTLTDQPERVLCAEILREKVLLNMQEEVPHGIAITIEEMKERQGPEAKTIMDIQAVIYCERQSHKGMVIGKGGQMLKNIASAARTDMEAFLDVKVNLQCWVKVKEDWRNQERFIRNFGFQ
ncbi:MAG: GTPase Era [Angelakisella sp.]|nr:GTPase Era [Angelakisella sp.]